jgi:serine protease Do
MNELVIIEAVERYLNNEMTQDELFHFEALRKNDVELDQFVVNHIAFLNQVTKTADIKNLIHTIDSVRAELITDKEIDIETVKPEAKVVGFWEKNRKKLALAASVAALITVSALGWIFAYNNSKNDNKVIEVVSHKVNALEKQVNDNLKKDNSTKPYIETDHFGTGFMLHKDGYIITNHHVLKNVSKVYVYNEKFGDLEASVVIRDQENDITILKITDTSFKFKGNIPYALIKQDVQLAQSVYTLGYCRPPELTYNQGAVSSKAVNDNLQRPNNFLLTLQVDGGNSGSPIFNKNGEIIGIVSAKEKQDNGFTFGIKTSSLENVFNTMNTQNFGKVELNNNSLNGLSLEKQIKKVEDFIFMVKAK